MIVCSGGLPLVVQDPARTVPREVFEQVRRGYYMFFGEEPRSELVCSWKSSIRAVLRAARGYPVIIEYPILGGLDRIGLDWIG